MICAAYVSPVGKIILTSDGEALAGLNFAEQVPLPGALVNLAETAIFAAAKKWLDIYFAGAEPDFSLPLQASRTPFQQRVREIVRQVPYGATVTYGDVARRISREKPPFRAVGKALGSNPVLIVVPCHRVVGANGYLGGYAAGIVRKRYLLALEKSVTERS